MSGAEKGEWTRPAGGTPAPRSLVRRQLLGQALAVLCAGIGLGAWWPPGGGTGLGALFADAASARRVGALYLRDHPDEAGARRLGELLFGGGAPPPALGSWLRERRSHDFAAADVVFVAGWLLSRSEARLCALSSLLGPRA